MYVTREMLDDMEARFGKPKHASFRIPVLTKEFDFIQSTQKQGRRHDVTVYTIKDSQIVVIAKPFYPDGLYRAPSGGINPGEDFIAGTQREHNERGSQRDTVAHE